MLSGSNYLGPHLQARVGGIPANTVAVSGSTGLTIVAPSFAAGTVNISVTNDQIRYSIPMSFQYEGQRQCFQLASNEAGYAEKMLS